MRPDRGHFGSSAPLADLLAILLRQLKRPLASHGVELTDADTKTFGEALASGAELPENNAKLRSAVAAVVAESEALLSDKWDLTFQQSLDTPMNDIPGWETTAEFLDIANEKTNAELRISTGAALLVALGEWRYADCLVFLAAREENDVDAAVARRVLLFRCGVDEGASDWLAQVKDCLTKQQSAD